MNTVEAARAKRDTRIKQATPSNYLVLYMIGRMSLVGCLPWENGSSKLVSFNIISKEISHAVAESVFYLNLTAVS